MESAVTMMEVEESPCKDSAETIRSNGEVNGSCDDASMDTCSSPESSQPVSESGNSNDSSRFTEIQQKVPTSEVPTDEPVTLDSDEDEDVPETPNKPQSEQVQNKSSSEMNGQKCDNDLTNGTEDDAISVDSGSSEEQQNIESVDIGDTDSSDNEEISSNNLNVKVGRDTPVKGSSNDSDSGTTSHNKHSNGDLCSSPDVQVICDKNSSSEVINLDKSSKNKKNLESFTPRRSSRNLNRQRSYIHREDEMEDSEDVDDIEDLDPDIEEIMPEDPLGMSDNVNSFQNNSKDVKDSKKSRGPSLSGSTIVVKDTKRLVEIATTSKSSTPSSGKKEPTLVIIDTNSILSGRGPVPVTQKSTNASTSSYSMLPMALPAQGVYPANMRATITPIPMPPKATPVPPQSIAPQPPTIPTPILPSLTDDMYVVEAPSFIVPYVYEKPPVKPLKEYVVKVAKELAEQAKKEQEEKAKEKGEKSPKSSEKTDESSENKNKKADNEKKENSESNTKTESQSNKESKEDTTDKKPTAPEMKVNSYFDNPLGKFFSNIGFNLVQEYVQADLLKQQKRKKDREGGYSAETEKAIASIIFSLEISKENNEPFHMPMKKCDYCNFRTESALVLAHHLETPHMRNYIYRCNFCPLEVRNPHDILFHMEAEHNTRGRLERAAAFHECPNCPFEDNQKGKLTRHLIACAKKYKPEKNLEPPSDWEPPAKIPRLPRGKQVPGFSNAALIPGSVPYAAFAQAKNIPLVPTRLQPPQSNPLRPRGRPSLLGKQPSGRSGMIYRPTTSGLLVPTSYQYGGNQIFTVVSGNGLGVEAESLQHLSASASIPPLSVTPQGGSNLTIQSTSSASSSNRSITNKLAHQPSISITPLPRQSSQSGASSSSSANPTMPSVKPGDPAAGKATFVICEICDGYIKDLEQLRNHMQWIHKVKIHPKMIYNRPPLNCQKCQFRFFTDQGLERHLLGSHGLVTSSMQEAANKGKDAGRCPVCGRVYQWKLLNHVARDHKITLKPAHLSYKCTVCTATFGMYKQFENHVYSAHSVVAKRVIEKKNNVSSSRSNSDSLLKPLKINDEITIIPQPIKPKAGSSSRSEKV